MERGRIGYEAQFALLVNRHVLRFDTDSQKLGTAFDLQRLAPKTPWPPGWRFVADPSPKTAYLERGQKPPADWTDYFSTDHHERYADTVGYRSYWVWQDCEHVCFQLELVSDPMPPDAPKVDLLKALRTIYRDNLSEMLERGAVRAWDHTTQQHVREQVSIEIDDVRWPDRVHPLDTLMQLGLGMWWLTRFREHLRLDADLAAILDTLANDIRENRRERMRFDGLTNASLLMDAWFSGWLDREGFRWVRRVATGRGFAYALWACFNNDVCYVYPHGWAEVSGDELASVSARDQAILRGVGIDPDFSDLLGGIDQPHVHVFRMRRKDVHRRGIGLFCDEAMSTFVRSCWEGRPPAEVRSLPLCHPRKTITEGCVYLEFRHLHQVKFAKRPRYPAQFYPVRAGDLELEVIFAGHLWALGRDLKWLVQLAVWLGARIRSDIAREAPMFRDKLSDWVRDEHLDAVNERLATFAPK